MLKQMMQSIINFSKKAWEWIKAVLGIGEVNIVQELCEIKSKVNAMSPKNMCKNFVKETSYFFVTASLMAGLARYGGDSIKWVMDYVELPYGCCLRNGNLKVIKLLYSIVQTVCLFSYYGASSQYKLGIRI